ncbi:hypothetical protein BaRGS_00040228 [Batillaria attramentaria]|uniref:Secreted protein n=1 Tax=Batillaria attramentaria TaxID=370345 RepID=A0ABD0J0Z5_9CAEN
MIPMTPTLGLEEKAALYKISITCLLLVLKAVEACCFAQLVNLHNMAIWNPQWSGKSHVTVVRCLGNPEHAAVPVPSS